MRKLLAVTACAVLIATPKFAEAQLTFATATNVSATTVTANVGSQAIAATFVGAPGTTLVGPFQMTFGGIFGSAINDIVCVDLNNSFTDGQSYSANLTFLSSSDEDLLLRTRWGMGYGDAATTRHLYLKMAWLAQHFDTQPSEQWGAIQGAIWHLSTGGWLPFDTNSDVQSWLTLAYNTDLSAVDATGWAVVTDVNATGFHDGAQEFLVRTNVVPEPSTYLLMATGLLGVVLVARHRSVASTESSPFAPERSISTGQSA